MGLALVAAMGIALVIAVAMATRSSALDRAVTQALDSGETAPVRDALEDISGDERPTAYNFAISRMWEKFERKLACDLIVDLAEQHHDTNIAQYWMREAMTTEPGIARERFTETFLESFYRPEVAARCGKFG